MSEKEFTSSKFATSSNSPEQPKKTAVTKLQEKLQGFR